MPMDIIETRRERLRQWVKKNGTPQKEKSLFSQLKSTGSFGEKVARRLELKYAMGVGYLDTYIDVEPASATVETVVTKDTSPSRAPYYSWLNEDEMYLVTLYRTTTDRGRNAILKEAELVEKEIQSPTLVRNDP